MKFWRNIGELVEAKVRLPQPARVYSIARLYKLQKIAVARFQRTNPSGDAQFQASLLLGFASHSFLGLAADPFFGFDAELFLGFAAGFSSAGFSSALAAASFPSASSSAHGLLAGFVDDLFHSLGFILNHFFNVSRVDASIQDQFRQSAATDLAAN